MMVLHNPPFNRFFYCVVLCVGLEPTYPCRCQFEKLSQFLQSAFYMLLYYSEGNIIFLLPCAYRGFTALNSFNLMHSAKIYILFSS